MYVHSELALVISQTNTLDLIITNRWRGRIKSETDDDWENQTDYH